MVYMHTAGMQYSELYVDPGHTIYATLKCPSFINEFVLDRKSDENLLNFPDIFSTRNICMLF